MSQTLTALMHERAPPFTKHTLTNPIKAKDAVVPKDIRQLNSEADNRTRSPQKNELKCNHKKDEQTRIRSGAVYQRLLADMQKRKQTQRQERENIAVGWNDGTQTKVVTKQVPSTPRPRSPMATSSVNRRLANVGPSPRQRSENTPSQPSVQHQSALTERGARRPATGPASRMTPNAIGGRSVSPQKKSQLNKTSPRSVSPPTYIAERKDRQPAALCSRIQCAVPAGTPADVPEGEKLLHMELCAMSRQLNLLMAGVNMLRQTIDLVDTSSWEANTSNSSSSANCAPASPDASTQASRSQLASIPSTVPFQSYVALPSTPRAKTPSLPGSTEPQ